MAWQLIYTSAPRSLEAGRSGFGTVARHREISPLLVSAIERASQFSRQPGLDVNRVIYCYRVIAVAGGRYHVLSSIRDAGADYTGRTNHIAHHLVAEPREIARIGGVSPADVLLGMRWATSWTEPPRYFEAAEEVSLGDLAAQVTGLAWEQWTGQANQAWLLAAGEASRGAYVITPAGVDLRQIFGESLQLTPERLWQIAFTTSLQPSDEPADFRWIGVEEHSALRAQAENSGRPVLNLAQPSQLPVVETVPSPAVETPAPEPVLEEIPAVIQPEVEDPQAVFARSLPPLPEPGRYRTSSGWNDPGAVQKIPRSGGGRISHVQWIISAAVTASVAVALFAWIVVKPRIKKELHRYQAREDIQQSLSELGSTKKGVGQSSHEELKEEPEGASTDQAIHERVDSSGAVAARPAGPAHAEDGQVVANKPADVSGPPTSEKNTPGPLWYLVPTGDALSVGVPADQALKYFVIQKKVSRELIPSHAIVGGLGAYGEEFSVEGGRLQAGKSAPKGSYELSLRAADGTELIHVYVGLPDGSAPLLGEKALSLKREGDVLKVQGPVPKFSVGSGVMVSLATPNNFMGLGPPISLSQSAVGEFSLAGCLDALRKRIEARQNEAQVYAKQLSEAGTNNEPVADHSEIEKEKARLRAAIAAAEKEAANSAGLAILKADALPPGSYRLVATLKEGKSVNLFEFTVK